MLHGEKRTAHFLAPSYLTPYFLLSPVSFPRRNLMKFRLEQKYEPARVRGIEREYARVGETPFDQLRLINGVGGGVVMANGHGSGRGGEGWKGEWKGEESVAMSEPTGALCGFMLLKM